MDNNHLADKETRFKIQDSHSSDQYFRDLESDIPRLQIHIQHKQSSLDFDQYFLHRKQNSIRL